MSTSLSYRDAGVDIDAGDQLVENIKPFAKRTMRPEVLGDLGGFGALVEIGKKYKNPVLVSGTDGVGTKLKLAFDWDKHDTVGIDLVAMSVNDILVQGAEPLFFLDYFACGKLDVARATDVIKGIAQGCEESGCALIGGETAEMPGMYPEGEYDLAGNLSLPLWKNLPLKAWPTLLAAALLKTSLAFCLKIPLHKSMPKRGNCLNCSNGCKKQAMWKPKKCTVPSTAVSAWSLSLLKKMPMQYKHS